MIALSVAASFKAGVGEFVEVGKGNNSGAANIVIISYNIILETIQFVYLETVKGVSLILASSAGAIWIHVETPFYVTPGCQPSTTYPI